MRTAFEENLESVIGLVVLVLSTIGFLTEAYTIVAIGLVLGAVGFGMLLARQRG
jgi:hypothetical protein